MTSTLTTALNKITKKRKKIDVPAVFLQRKEVEPPQEGWVVKFFHQYTGGYENMSYSHTYAFTSFTKAIAYAPAIMDKHCELGDTWREDHVQKDNGIPLASSTESGWQVLLNLRGLQHGQKSFVKMCKAVIHEGNVYMCVPNIPIDSKKLKIRRYHDPNEKEQEQEEEY